MDCSFQNSKLQGRSYKGHLFFLSFSKPRLSIISACISLWLFLFSFACVSLCMLDVFASSCLLGRPDCHLQHWGSWDPELCGQIHCRSLYDWLPSRHPYHHSSTTSFTTHCWKAEMWCKHAKNFPSMILPHLAWFVYSLVAWLFPSFSSVETERLWTQNLDKRLQ